MDQIYTPQELEHSLGENLRALRLQKNLDQETLSKRAGVSVTALRNLESGNGATTKTLVRVVNALGRQEWLASVAPIVSINPLHMVRMQPVRQRASRRKGPHG